MNLEFWISNFEFRSGKISNKRFLGGKTQNQVENGLNLESINKLSLFARNALFKKFLHVKGLISEIL